MPGKIAPKLRTTLRHYEPDDVRQLLALRIREAGGQAAWAQVHDLSATYVNDVVRLRRPPGPAIAAALGLRVKTVFVEVT